jgi:hypothetical protein
MNRCAILVQNSWDRIIDGNANASELEMLASVRLFEAVAGLLSSGFRRSSQHAI